MGQKLPAQITSNYSRLASMVEPALACFQNLSVGKLRDACAYSVNSPGKRFRPVLVLAGAELLGLEAEKLIPAAAAVELLHTASLVHDDLPAIDNDSLRRGRPTTHTVFGEAAGLLSGDALIAQAFYLIAASSLSSAQQRHLVESYSQAFVEICEGQVLDLEGSSHLPQDERRQMLALRHKKKTGALIAAALSSAAALFEPAQTTQVVVTLKELGLSLGLLFQITDDILDATSSTEQLGKHVRSDERLGRTTYVTEYGLDGAKKLAADACAKTVTGLERFGSASAFLIGLTSWVLERKH